jgi:hypothetical protein
MRSPYPEGRKRQVASTARKVVQRRVAVNHPSCNHRGALPMSELGHFRPTHPAFPAGQCLLGPDVSLPQIQNVRTLRALAEKSANQGSMSQFSCREIKQTSKEKTHEIRWMAPAGRIYWSRGARRTGCSFTNCVQALETTKVSGRNQR